MNREPNHNPIETGSDSGATNRPDVVDLAIDALAAPRWSGSPDWRSLQEQIMSHRSSFWSRTAVLSLVAGGVLAAGATAALWDWFPISGTMTLNSGKTAEVSGEMSELGGGASFEANVDTGGADISSGGSMEITMPDGGKATLVVEPSNGGAAPNAPTPPKKD